MKTLMSLLTCILFTTSIFSQNFIERNFKNKLEDENTTRIQLSKKMFELATTFTSEMDDKDLQKAHDIIKNIEAFDLIVMHDLKDPFAEFQRVTSQLKDYDDLIRVKDKNNNVSIVIKGDDEVIHEIVGVVSNKEEFVVFTLTGNIDIKEIGKLTDAFQTEALGSLTRTKDIGTKETKVMPNPVKKGDDVEIILAEEFNEGNINVADASGRVLKTVRADGKSAKINTNGFASGTYTITVEKGAAILTKKLIVIE